MDKPPPPWASCARWYWGRVEILIPPLLPAPRAPPWWAPFFPQIEGITFFLRGSPSHLWWLRRGDQVGCHFCGLLRHFLAPDGGGIRKPPPSNLNSSPSRGILCFLGSKWWQWWEDYLPLPPQTLPSPPQRSGFVFEERVGGEILGPSPRWGAHHLGDYRYTTTAIPTLTPTRTPTPSTARATSITQALHTSTHITTHTTDTPASRLDAGYCLMRNLEMVSRRPWGA